MQDYNRFGIMNALLSVINAGSEGEADTAIATYLLEHFYTLPELTIYDIATACSTTRQQVRRFCQRIGLSNFRMFKRERLAMEYEFYGSYRSVENYPAVLAHDLAQMALDINATAVPHLDRFCEQIHMADRVVFLVSDIYSSSCLEFQKQMILLGKALRIVSNNFQTNPVLHNLTARDLVVIISVSGRWARELIELIDSAPACRVLITAMHDATLHANFDDVLPLSSSDQPQVKTAYHTFGIPYVLELTQQRYRDRYLPRELMA